MIEYFFKTSLNIKQKQMEEIVIINNVAFVMVISETWKKDEKGCYYSFKIFVSIYFPRLKRGGGIGISIDKNIDF